MATATCMLILSVLHVSIVILCHMFFVVHVVTSAISATYMQTVSRQYVIFKNDKT